MNTTLPPTGPRAYRIERFIGRGGFGCVYLAQNLAAGALGRVALKVMDEGAAEEWVARFFHEARVLSSLSGYPYFVGVNAVFKMERRFCIDMEFVPGLTLDDLLERHGPLPLDAALQITRQIAIALDAAYNRARDEDGQLLRVLHRDLKPGNLRLGVGGGVKVLDFGLARSEITGVRPETLRVLPATLAYMAPERFQFRSAFGHAADLYALGLTCYELLAGKPFLDTAAINPCLEPDRGNLEAWTELKLNELIARRAPPAPLIELLSAMLRFDPDARPTGPEIDRACRAMAGVDGEDRYREWIEGPLERLSQEAPRVTRVDPWSWVGTVRRSGADGEPAPRDEGPATETFLPDSVPASSETLLAEVEPTTHPEPAPRRRQTPLLLALGGAAALGLALLLGRGPAQTWALSPDQDGDGFGAGEAISWGEPSRPGYAAQAGDCDDASAGVHPGAPERCDGRDDDCDGQIDEDLPLQTYFVDGDGDGVGGAEIQSCAGAPAAGQVRTGGDCDDADPANRCAAHPTRERVATAPSAASAAPAGPPPPQGTLRMVGTEASAVRLRGPVSARLTPGASRSADAGSYTATVEFDGGDYEVTITLNEGETLTFDCTERRMGSPCTVR